MQMEMDAWRVVVVVVLAGALAMAMTTEGAMDRRCLNQLAPCSNYLNNTGKEDVPSSCCDPLEEVVESEPECICSMISNQGASQAERAGINLTLAQQLPGRCGIRINPLGCITTTGASGPSSDNSSGGESWLRRISMLPWLAALIGSCLVDEFR